MNRYLHKSKVITLIFLIVLVIGCGKPENKENDLVQMKAIDKTHSVKPVILINVDSMLSSAIDEGISKDMLPTFKFLKEHGQYHKEFVSSFPTMSVTIDSTLLTGTYPDKHRIPGLVWYSSADKDVINYGTGIRDIMRRGPNPFLSQVFVDLNNKHLSKNAPTIYEDLAKLGLKSGSVNGIIYRGNTDHQLSFPSWLSGPTSLPEAATVKGPDFFTFAAFSNPLRGIIDLPENVTKQMGMNNEYAANVASYLIQTGQVPDFLYVYFPELDQALHRDGPSHMKKLIEVDQQIKGIMQNYGSLDEALRKAIFIVAGDSGVSQVQQRRENPVIKLTELFQNYNLNNPGDPVTDQTDLILAANETMAYVYNANGKYSNRTIADRLSTDKRIDLISWRENGWINVIKGNNLKEMRYKPIGIITDPYLQKWTLEGSVEVLDLNWNHARNTVDYGDYPDALQRLSSALNSHDGEYFVITSKPGFEFIDKSNPAHQGGGAHGSLHKSDSLIPVLIGGTEHRPRSQRIVDFKSYLLELIGHE
ncbi:alkaline phosphatase family protein [Paenibacillus sp. LjRoot153]|uniref:alkaline phosphatase family protein n=1 Tax=Paenibacillus sp. LjRoot153 TaxID=3342270 RepID=UPI003ECDFA5A